MRVVFARHGESQANLLREISDRGLSHGLTREGRQQAVALADRLRGMSITRVYSSPVLRAIETSVLVAHRMAVDYEVVDALRECDCGILEGRADEEAWQQHRSLYEAWLHHGRWKQSIEGGESAVDVRTRFVPFVDGLVRQYGSTEATVLCVSHGGLYLLALPFVLKNIDHRQLVQHRFGYTSHLVAVGRPDGLVCVEWDGRPVPEVAGSP